MRVMGPALHVLTSGLSTTVQDPGRIGYQHMGLTTSGALDVVGLRAANAMVGNPPGAGALEVLYAGPTLIVEADSASLSFAGAAAHIKLLRDSSDQDGVSVDSMRSVFLQRGQGIPGSIQVPGSGKPIVLLADRQTTGGYAKIATVISADVSALGRVPIGKQISFEPVSLEVALDLRRQFLRELQEIDSNVVPLRSGDFEINKKLREHNLISGACCAHEWD
jgi:allophanate hydrolase subunit 2